MKGSKKRQDARSDAGMRVDVEDKDSGIENGEDPANSEVATKCTASDGGQGCETGETAKKSDEPDGSVETPGEAEGAETPEDGQGREVAGDAETPEDGDAEGEKESDHYLTYLTTEHHRYRLIAFVLALCGFSLILASVGLYASGFVGVRVYSLIQSVAYFFIVIMAVIIFTRVRLYKRQIKNYTGQPLHTVIDPDAPDGVRIEENRSMPEMDDMYKIFERKGRTEVIPETPEYRKLRRTWLTLLGIAGVIAVVSLVAYALAPEWAMVTTATLLVAFVLVMVAFYVDRTKMKPLRNEWTARFGMNEMQYRDNMH